MLSKKAPAEEIIDLSLVVHGRRGEEDLSRRNCVRWSIATTSASASASFSPFLGIFLLLFVRLTWQVCVDLALRLVTMVLLAFV